MKAAWVSSARIHANKQRKIRENGDRWVIGTKRVADESLWHSYYGRVLMVVKVRKIGQPGFSDEIVPFVLCISVLTIENKTIVLDNNFRDSTGPQHYTYLIHRPIFFALCSQSSLGNLFPVFVILLHSSSNINYIILSDRCSAFMINQSDFVQDSHHKRLCGFVVSILSRAKRQAIIIF